VDVTGPFYRACTVQDHIGLGQDHLEQYLDVTGPPNPCALLPASANNNNECLRIIVNPSTIHLRASVNLLANV
jgi:hypothetical protein